MATNAEYDVATSSGPSNPQQRELVEGDDAQGTPRDKPTVIGLYGVPGRGEPYLFGQLEASLGQQHFQFIEGSQEIASHTNHADGLGAFRRWSVTDQWRFREAAGNNIQNRCSATGRVAVVSGHAMFWPQRQKEADHVYTASDLTVHTHMFYLDTPPSTVARRCKEDLTRHRSGIYVDHVQQ